MTSKKIYGQFYTTNSDYILNNLKVPKDIDLVEPFTGQGDLVEWCHRDIDELYDIEPCGDFITQRDTLKNPPDYKGKFVITNPPYLARNKNDDKSIYDQYKTDDLYKAAILSMIKGDVEGGILIIPLNFFCSRDYKVRDLFFSNYTIDQLNVFEEQVFDDTSYTICSFSFQKGKQKTPINTTFFPSKDTMKMELDRNTEWKIGGHLFKPITSRYKIGRLMIGDKPTTNLKLYSIDTGTMKGRIRLEIDENHHYGKLTDRTVATITSNQPIEDEQHIVKRFNETLEHERNKYHSMFLNTYRNSTKSYVRKRISFIMAYNLITEILENETTRLHKRGRGIR